MREYDLAAVIQPPVTSTDTATHADSATMHWQVWYDNAHPQYPFARNALNKSFKDFEMATWKQRVAEVSEHPLLTPIEPTNHSLASLGDQSRTQLAGILPFIILIMAITGAFYPAVDAIAGERERGTLETLLVWPAGRSDIFIGKLVVTAGAALVTVGLNIISLGLTVGIGASVMEGSRIAALTEFHIGIPTLLAAILLLAPLTLTIATLSLALSGLAKSFKEAQNYLTPLFLVVFVPAMAVLLPTIKPTPLLDMVPIVGPLVVLKDALQNDGPNWWHVMAASATSIALAWIIISWATRLLNDENFLYPAMKIMDGVVGVALNVRFPFLLVSKPCYYLLLP